MQNIDPNSRDYDPNSIVADERFTQTAKEFWITLAVYSIFVFLMIANLFTLGANAAAHGTVFGMPLWIFLEILIIVGMVVAQELVVTYVYKDMDVTPHGSIKDKKKGE